MAAAAPTARAALALTAIALAALVLPAWLPAAGAVVLLAAATADGFAVRDPPVIERSVARALSRGVRTRFRARARTPDRRRVLLRQPAVAGVTFDVPVAENELDGLLLPQRRGRHELPAVASASIGPLGLVRVHHPAGPEEQLRVYPDLVAAQALIARLRRQLAGHPDGVARGPLGLGTDFESIRDYTPDDDIRQLNWRASARMGRPMSNQFRVERDRDVVCLLDAGRLMAAQLGERTVLDAALDAAVLVALAADELGDRCGAIAFDSRIRRQLAPRHLGAREVVEALFDLEPTLTDSDFELAFNRAGGSRRGIVLAFTDLVDEAAARSLLAGVTMLARRHALIIASPRDPALEELAAAQATSAHAAASAIVASDMLRTRALTAARLRRAGASVVEASADGLAEHCLDAYVRLKARMVL